MERQWRQPGVRHAVKRVGWCERNGKLVSDKLMVMHPAELLSAAHKKYFAMLRKARLIRKG